MLRRLLILLVIFAFPPALFASPREVREPPHWTGTLDPLASTCPYSFTKGEDHDWVAICKTAIAGNVANVLPFAPGIFEDKNDGDWNFLKPYWNSSRKFYFAATGCSSGTNEQMARAGAQQSSLVNVLRLVARWNNELKQGKFRPFLEFREAERKDECKTTRQQGAPLLADAEPISPRVVAVTPPEPDRNAVTFKMTIEDKSPVHIQFYAEGSSHVWPDGGNAWVVKDYDEHTYSLACTAGQKICYGAWRASDPSTAWGVGRQKATGCTNCCRTCGSGAHKFTLNAGPEGPPRNALSIDVRSLDRYAVELAFYSEDATRAWPGGDQIYLLNTSEFKSFRLGCNQGEKICYGAWRRGNANSYWGRGKGGRLACANCCMTCGSGTHRHTLNAGADGGGGGGGDSFIGDVITGLGVGATIGGAILGGGGGGGGYTPRQQTPAPRRPPQRQSDISGTR